MSKITMVFLVLAALYLFAPRYDLYEQDGTWSERFVLRKPGFWLQQNCHKAGRLLDDPYKCYVTSTWQGMWGKQVDVEE